MTPELREPDLPRTARVRTGVLRSGWTTGSCASAAAKAAALVLAGGHAPAEVEVALANGARVRFPVQRVTGGPGWAEAVVVKDAGDDPDVTDGAHLTVRLAWAAGTGLTYRAGDGVGTVTKPGLGLEIGGPAINPVPRRVIAEAVGEVIDTAARGVACTVSVPGGEKMARKTTNRRLGIVGGISILGTTGIVRPFSTASWLASVVQAVDVLAAQGADMLVLATGGRSERAAMAMLPDLDEGCFVEVGDFTGAALRRAAERRVTRVVFVGMAGKLSKLAAGVLMTHYTRSKVDTDLLAEITAEAGGDPAAVAAVRAANTARHAYELWRAHGLSGAPDLLCARVADNLTRFTGGAVSARAAMVDFDTLEPVGRSGGWTAR
ncbi:MAG TPA: cobalt-precorrin-5B (C(1))-methyltransferase [Egibacteraceae bacterium]|nr:cobalt-precorrin-5B (C(1))-methyltransferase [Egibacteraceae bacterium]